MRELIVEQKPVWWDNSPNVLRYFTEIGHIPIITTEEEVELAQKIRQNDKGALEKLVKANLKFVTAVAKKYSNSYLSLNDLINEGNLGLIEAARRFDETKGFKFISYAVWWIRCYIMQALGKKSKTVRVPVNRYEESHELKVKYAELEQKLERNPTEEELADLMRKTPRQIRLLLGTMDHQQLSLDMPFREDAPDSLLDVMTDGTILPTDDQLAFKSLKEEVIRALATLTKQERGVVEKSFGIGIENCYTDEEIRHFMSISRNQVKAVREDALDKLRKDPRLRAYWVSR